MVVQGALSSRLPGGLGPLGPVERGASLVSGVVGSSGPPGRYRVLSSRCVCAAHSGVRQAWQTHVLRASPAPRVDWLRVRKFHRGPASVSPLFLSLGSSLECAC